MAAGDDLIPFHGRRISHDTHPTLLSGEVWYSQSAAAVVQFLTVWDADPSRCWLESDLIFVLLFLFRFWVWVSFLLSTIKILALEKQRMAGGAMIQVWYCLSFCSRAEKYFCSLFLCVVVAVPVQAEEVWPCYRSQPIFSLVICFSTYVINNLQLSYKLMLLHYVVAFTSVVLRLPSSGCHQVSWRRNDCGLVLSSSFRGVAGSAPSKVAGANGTSPAVTSSSGFLELSNPFLLNILPWLTKHWLFSPCLVQECLKFNIPLKDIRSLWLNFFVLLAHHYLLQTAVKTEL